MPLYSIMQSTLESRGLGCAIGHILNQQGACFLKTGLLVRTSHLPLSEIDMSVATGEGDGQSGSSLTFPSVAGVVLVAQEKHLVALDIEPPSSENGWIHLFISTAIRASACRLGARTSKDIRRCCCDLSEHDCGCPAHKA